LAQRNAENLHAKLVEVNEMKKLVRQLPSQRQVADWVAQAKMLPRVIQY
jgi:Tfp pilus assembly protein PilO